MPFPNSPYVDQRGDGLYVTGSRVCLDSVVLAFLGGDSPDTITQSFSTLEPSMVYGSIAYYLEHKSLIDISPTQIASSSAPPSRSAKRIPHFFPDLRLPVASWVQSGREP
jgi:uncharacterized protein (DUF433 family)